MTLRPYQRDLATRAEQLLLKARSVMLQASTGSGKTEMALAITEKFLSFGGMVAWMTHRDELLGQVEKRANGMGLPTERTWESRKWEPGKLNISTVGKMLRNPPPGRSLLVADEGHHLFAKTWREVWLSHAGSRLALSATPWRLNKKEGFEDLIDDLICAPQPAKLLEGGFLEQINVFQSRSIFNVQGLKRVAGDFHMKSFEEAFGDRLVKEPVGVWERHGDNGRRSCLVYAPTKETAILLAGALGAAGAVAGLVLSGKKPEVPEGADFVADRREALHGFREGYLDTLVSVDILGEGVDIPHADMAIFVRPTMSLALYLQHIGRLARIDLAFPEPSIAYDLVGNVIRHGLPYQDREWSLEPRENGTGPKTFPLRVCYACNAVLPASQYTCHLCEQPREKACPECEQLLPLGFFGPDKKCSLCSTELPLEGLEQGAWGFDDRRKRKEKKRRPDGPEDVPPHHT